MGFNYSKTMGKQYFSARFPHCSFLCGSFFMTNASFFPERALCDWTASAAKTQTRIATD